MERDSALGSLSWDDIERGSELVYNLLHCIRVEVQPARDEATLERRAEALLRDNRFLAGTTLPVRCGVTSGVWGW